MIGIALLCVGGLALAWAIYDQNNDDTTDYDQDIEGTEGDDLLQGGIGNDAILGFGGDDTMSGEGGSDRIVGDEGNDIGLGGEGDDTLRGSEGIDMLQGGSGDDTLFGDTGDDWVDGGTGDDVVQGGSGGDVLIGGEGEDTLTADGGDDALFGGNFLERELTPDELAAVRDDFAAGQTPTLPAALAVEDDQAADVMDGGRGDDLLYVGDGDEATGGDGMDEFYFLNGQSADPATVMDYTGAEDSLIYLYDSAAGTPTIDVTDNGDGTYTFSADGEEVAVIASDTALTAADIMLYATAAAPASQAAAS